MSDFTDSLEKILLGSPRGIVLSKADRERTAYHESGHALVGMLTPGADPVRGLVVTGTVTAARPSGAGWEADVSVGDAAFTCRLPSRPLGAELSVTVLDPPYFGRAGTLLAPDINARYE